jgi:hypothetical protein
MLHLLVWITVASTALHAGWQLLPILVRVTCSPPLPSGVLGTCTEPARAFAMSSRNALSCAFSAGCTATKSSIRQYHSSVPSPSWAFLAWRSCCKLSKVQNCLSHSLLYNPGCCACAPPTWVQLCGSLAVLDCIVILLQLHMNPSSGTQCCMQGMVMASPTVSGMMQTCQVGVAPNVDIRWSIHNASTCSFPGCQAESCCQQHETMLALSTPLALFSPAM